MAATFTVIPDANFSKALFVENAGPAEVDPSFKAVEALTVTAVATLCVGTTPSVTWQIRHAASATNRAAGTLIASGTSTSVTTGETASVDVDVPADLALGAGVARVLLRKRAEERERLLVVSILQAVVGQPKDVAVRGRLPVSLLQCLERLACRVERCFGVNGVLVPGLRPEVIAVAAGQGHTDYGRYATNRGGNPFALLAPPVAADGDDAGLVGTPVSLRKVT